MKRAKKGGWLTLSMVLLTAAVSVANQAPAVSFVILPFQDESGAQVPADLLAKLAQDLAQKLNLSHQDILARVIAGVPETAAMGAEQLAAFGQQQGIRFIVRGGILALASEKTEQTLSCRIGLYAELIDCQSGAASSLRANGDGAEENAAIEDTRQWDAYDFGSGSFAQTALGRALAAAVDQLIPQLYQAALAPSQETPETAPADQTSEPQPSDEAASYEADEDLQQLIAQAESIAASRAAAGMDISELQQALDSLRSALNDKILLLEQGQETAAADQEIARRAVELQNILDAIAQSAAAEPPPGEAQTYTGEERKNIIQKVGGLLDDTLAAILKIQEIRAALRGAQEDQAYEEAPIEDESAAPMEEPTADVSGVVVDESGDPVEGVTVTDPQSGAEATTDSSGSYRIPRIPSGRFADIVLTKNGRRLSSGKIQVFSGRSALADWKVSLLGGGGPGPTAAKILPSNIILVKKAGVQSVALGTVAGTASDERGRPVARALVLIKGVGAARTDSRGRYAFINVPQGSYRVVVQRAGMAVQTFEVKVVGKKATENKILVAGKTAGRPLAGPVVLVKGSGTILRGLVINEEKKPLSRAKITVVPSGGGGLTVFSGVKGAFEFKDLKPGSYRLLVNKAGFQEASQAVVLRAGRAEARNFTLKTTSAQIQKIISAKNARLVGRQAGGGAVGHLQGQILDIKNRKPIADATVQASGRPAVRTDSRGRYRLSNLPPGNYRVVAGHPDYQTTDKSVTIRSNVTRQEDFSLERKDTPKLDTHQKVAAIKVMPSFGQMRGRVTDAKSGKPIAQVSVALSNRTAQSNGSGDYSFANVPSGNYTVSFKKAGYQDGGKQVTVRGGQTVTVNIQLAPVLRLQMKKK